MIQPNRSSNTNADAPTGAPDAAATVSLPVLGGQSKSGTQTSIRPSRVGRWRAAVLIAVQLAMIAHLVQWAITGRTTTPIEPSESIETVRDGIVNAGAIFFSAALLSTLVLGRWFCGWGCHVVALQDGCAWLMRKCGVRPKPFRSRLLSWTPLILALYMFVWPAFYRLVLARWLEPGLQWPGWTVQLTTGEFWRTFPGVMIAIPFLFICGFATVYFLGAKGFCTYGCPYGGFFFPLDRLAIGRIRVTDACEGCGHCTAVCTSNVRVHEEVREFGMVVNPGCMKCLDCVSVCPNDALYFGFGRPSILKGAPRHNAPRARYDLTWKEEITLALAFAAAFFAWRGLYGTIPMLMAVGIALCATFLWWKAWRTKRDRDGRLHGFQLARGGQTTRAGWTLIAIALMLAALTVHGGLVQYHRWQGQRFADRVVVPYERLITGTATLDDAQADAAAWAIAHYRKADRLDRGGLGLAGTLDVSLGLARLHLARREFELAESNLRLGIDLNGGPTDVLAADLGRIMLLQGKINEARAWYEQVLESHPDFVEVSRLHTAIEGAGP